MKLRTAILAFVAGLFFARGPSTVCHAAEPTAEYGWSKDRFPATIDGARVLDPDRVLQPSQLQELDRRIAHVETLVNVPVGISGDSEQTGAGIQMAVVAVQKINTFDYRHYDDPEMTAIEDLARYLHDTWGVGLQTPVGGTGVLVAMAVHDRVIYVSRGGAVAPYLTDARIDRLVAELRPLLKDHRYHEALVEAADSIARLIQSGKPEWKERLWDMMPQFVVGGFLGAVGLFVYLGVQKQRRDDREYARVRAELDRLDRAQAEALRGQYQTTSCPICFEEFASDAVGSDDKPIRLLRCGHVFDETCWQEWVDSGTGNVTKCPICQRDVGTGTESVVRVPERNERADRQIRHRHGAFEREQDDNWIARQFRRERNFRLMRLAQQHPRFVGQDQVQRWTQPDYDGTLSTDRSFVRNDPRVVRETNSQQRRASDRVSFGGGSSSGGRGGRW